MPKGARIVSIAVAEDRLVVTVDHQGAIEVRTFDLQTLSRSADCGLRPSLKATGVALAASAVYLGALRAFALRLPSSSGPGRRPLTAKTGVRVP